MKTPLANKGCGFTHEERASKKLRGLMPAGVVTLDEQVDAVMARIAAINDPLGKFVYLCTIQDSNETLYYATLCKHTYACMPLVYTPVVGEGCQKYSWITRHQPRGLFISIDDRGSVRQILDNWPYKNIKAIVFTDGERILGLGDLGCDGMGIPVGKLALYSALAGVHPEYCLPVTLDMGTNNKEKLADPLYLGLKRPRVAPGPEVDDFVGEFITACHDAYGKNVLLQFEDFGNGNAFRLLHQWQDKACTFNDDIQGTASVVVAGLYAANRVTKTKLGDHTILFFGAGEAGVGIADLIADAIADECGCTRTEARGRIWLVDSRGLIVKDRSSGGIQEHKSHYAHEHAEVATLKDAIAALKPTMLLGVSTIPKSFDKEVIEMMMKNAEHPVIFALSNPTSKAECTAEECYNWSDGQVLFASGSPFEPVTLANGKTYVPGQGNNSYIFPGVGLACIAAGCTRIGDSDMLVAAKALATCVTEERLATGCLYPPLENIREVSGVVAAAVATAAWEKGTSTEPRPTDIVAHCRSLMYVPSY
jgi:malate dehydrogenase (oxaloacetate-decarboxylating)(NADP+)